MNRCQLTDLFEILNQRDPDDFDSSEHACVFEINGLRYEITFRRIDGVFVSLRIDKRSTE